MPKLIIQEGYQITGEFQIPNGTSVIGRNDGVALQITNHSGISREHCSLTRNGLQVVLEDLGSRNGTFVNSHPVTAPVILKNKDHIQLDDVLLVFDTSDISADDQTFADAEKTESIEWKNANIASVNNLAQTLCQNIRKVIQGKDEIIRKIVIALLSDGHILLEDVPGVGKTKLAQSLAKSINGSFKRIQFTSDMLPSDITGISIYDEAKHQFIFMPGPIFANIVLADEINRGTPRVQSSLLECMSESMVTVDGTSHILPKPFFVVATQNPVDSQGTYPLPEAQLDRFLMKLSIGYPDKEAEKNILELQEKQEPLASISSVVNATDLLHCQALIRTVHVSEPVRDYIISIIDETRRHDAFSYGCSPRAAIALMRCSQALAALSGRDFVLPRDVRDLSADVLSHRLPLKTQARARWQTSSDVIKEILNNLPLERWEKLAMKASNVSGTILR